MDLMSKKNALYDFFIQAHTGQAAVPTTGWLEIGAGITSVADETDESVDSKAYYDGDGTPEDVVTAVAKGNTFEGEFDPENTAMAYVKGKEFATGNDRKVWYKRVDETGAGFVGKATMSAITAGPDGEASEDASFKVTIKWDRAPAVVAAAPPEE
jgi:hypothetical protein